MSLPPRVRRSFTVLGATAGLVGAFVAGTAIASDDDPVHGKVEPIAFSGDSITLAASCDDLLDWYVTRGVRRVGPWGWDTYYTEDEDRGGFDFPNLGGGEDSGDSGDAVAGSAAESPQAYTPTAPATVRAENGDSGTNVQELGVDEPDVVKTDGRTLFRVEDDDLVTYDVTGADVERIGSADLQDLDDGELLLSGDTVVVIGTDGGGRGSYYPEARETRVIVLDVSDPSDPEVEHTYLYSSATLEARLHGDTVRLVTQAGMPDLDFETDDDQDDALRENRELVRDTDIEDWLPTVSTDGGDPEPLVDCADVAIPNDGDSLGTIVVVGFEADQPEDRSVSGLAVATQLAYLSSDQLYLATTGAGGEAVQCLDFDCAQERVAPDWLPGGGSDGVTHLYAFDLDGDETRYAASGEVDGWVRDRWAMDEADGVLRLAVGPSQKTGNYNSVVTFRRDGNDLVEAGRVDELGAGEDIKAVRWFDGLAIVVTFMQVDPLYAVDLTDPDDPDLLGELKIPGFSAYLHPLGSHRLLGVGEGPGDRGGWGAQAGLFDVTDLTDPRQLDVLSYGGNTRALVGDDPRQLTWLPERRQVLTVIESVKRGGQVGLVSVLSLGDGQLENRMVEVEQGSDVTQVRLVPLPDGRVVLVTARDAEFFDL
jgi:hypothetical protein